VQTALRYWRTMTRQPGMTSLPTPRWPSDHDIVT
jgi:hypothetical protein